ncbi:MAG: NifU family protein [Nocardioidaceae bacterium]
MGHPEQTESPPPDLRAAGDRIQTLLDASAAGGAVARERAEELVRILADLYGAGLERVLDILHDLGRLDDDVLAALADDDLVSSLLVVHGLHPYDVVTRVEQALESVRPYLGTHGGDVELLSVSDDGVVRLRLLGSCDGCPSSSVTLTLAVEGAVEAAAPEVTSIEVETTADGRRADRRSADLGRLAAFTSQRARRRPGWFLGADRRSGRPGVGWSRQLRDHRHRDPRLPGGL